MVQSLKGMGTNISAQAGTIVGGVLICVLYASLPPEAQMMAFAPKPPGCLRKIIISTNIAETSGKLFLQIYHDCWHGAQMYCYFSIFSNFGRYSLRRRLWQAQEERLQWNHWYGKFNGGGYQSGTSCATNWSGGTGFGGCVLSIVYRRCLRISRGGDNSRNPTCQSCSGRADRVNAESVRRTSPVPQ